MYKFITCHPPYHYYEFSKNHLKLVVKYGIQNIILLYTISDILKIPNYLKLFLKTLMKHKNRKTTNYF